MAKQSKIQSKKHWRGVLRALRKSGLGVAAFCRMNRIKPASLYAWRRRLGVPRAARGSRRGRAEKPETFVPVRVVAGGGATRPFLELVLKNGRVLRLFQEVSGPVLGELVRAAEAC